MKRDATALALGTGLVAWLAVVALGGCGGGATSSVPETGGETGEPPAHVSPAGSLIVETAASQDYGSITLGHQPLGGYIFTGIYRTTITRLEYRPSPGKLLGGGPNLGQIVVSNVNGGGVRVVLDSGSNKYEPRWSPDGRRIAFYTQNDRIVVCNADGSAPRVLNIQPLTDVAGLCFSPDGNYVYFSAVDATGDREIWRVSVNSGAAPARVTDISEAAWYPDISPDGRLLAFVKGSRIAIMPLWGTASNIRELPLGNHPRWSPDGRYIAYDRYSVADGYRLYVYDLLDDTEHLLETLPTWGYPDWSPDGRYVYFAYQSHLYRIAVDGSPGDSELLNSTWGGQPDCWAPADGRYRVLIGPLGSDWGGNNPPFGSSRPAAIVAYSARGYGGAVSLLGVGTFILRDRTPQASSGETVVCEARADQVRNVYQDRGPGVTRLNISLQRDGRYPGAVLLVFDATSAQLTSVIPVFEQASSASASSGLRVQATRGGLVVSGAPMTAIDPLSGRQLGDKLVWRLVLDRSGRVVR